MRVAAHIQMLDGYWGLLKNFLAAKGGIQAEAPREVRRRGHLAAQQQGPVPEGTGPENLRVPGEIWWNLIPITLIASTSVRDRFWLLQFFRLIAIMIPQLKFSRLNLGSPGHGYSLHHRNQ
jgi:hypothetical protein